MFISHNTSEYNLSTISVACHGPLDGCTKIVGRMFVEDIG